MLSLVSPSVSKPNTSIWTACKRLLSRPADHGWLCLLFLAAWCGILFFYGLTAAELWRTESLRAIIAQTMLQTGNWIVPALYGEPLFTKPPGMYVAIALCSLPFGEVSQWTARLPSALAASLTVFLFYRLFCRRFGRLGGLIAVVILPMSLIYLDKGTAAEIDMLQLAWVMGAILCLVRALEENDKEIADCRLQIADLGTSKSAICHLQSAIGNPRWRGFRWWLGAMVCVAGGVLTKWTAPAFFYATAVTLLWWRGRLHMLWSWPHLVSAALAAALVLSWVVAAVAMTGWDTFATTVLGEALPRIVPFYDQKHHQHHSYWLEVVLHPFWLLATALPWSIVALWSLRPGFARLWDERGRLLLAVFHCWTWPNLLFWTFMSDHTPRHASPLFPGLAGLASMVTLAWITGKMPLVKGDAERVSPLSLLWPWPRITSRQFFTAALVFWLLVKVVYVEAIMPSRNAHRRPRAKGQLIASLVPLASVLYLFRLKDEGIMFYFGRTVVRLKTFEQLPSSAEPVYCILDYPEWQQWQNRRHMEVLRHLTDEQGAHIVLVSCRGQ